MVLKKANKVHSFALKMGVLWRDKRSHDPPLFSSLPLPPLPGMIIFFSGRFLGPVAARGLVAPIKP